MPYIFACSASDVLKQLHNLPLAVPPNIPENIPENNPENNPENIPGKNVPGKVPQKKVPGNMEDIKEAYMKSKRIEAKKQEIESRTKYDIQNKIKIIMEIIIMNAVLRLKQKTKMKTKISKMKNTEMKNTEMKNTKIAMNSEVAINTKMTIITEMKNTEMMK